VPDQDHQVKFLMRWNRARHNKGNLRFPFNPSLYLVLFYLVLFYLVLFYLVLLYFGIILFDIILFGIILFGVIVFGIPSFSNKTVEYGI